MVSDAELLQTEMAENAVHVPKECLVTGLSSLTENIPFHVF